MPIVDRHVVSDITRALSSIRTSLDALTSYSRNNVGTQLLHEQAYLAFEQVRFVFRTELGRSRPRVVDDSYVDLGLLIGGLSKIIENPDFYNLFKTIKYRPFPAPREEGFRLDPALITSGMSVADAIAVLIRSVEYIDIESTKWAPQSDLFDTFRQLEKVVPQEQKLSPLQFHIIDGKISVLHQTPNPDPQDEASLHEAFDDLKTRGNQLVEDLKKSNCDPRLISGLESLQSQLVINKDVVRLGLSNIGLDILCEKLSPEIPDALSAMLKAHTVGLNLYVSQYPEWRRFTEQAAQANLQSTDLPHLKSSISEVVNYLHQNPDLAKPDVANSLASIGGYLHKLEGDMTRYAFATWRTIENFVITIFQYGSSLFKRTAESIDKQLPDALGKLAVRGLMGAALVGLTYLTPIATHLPDGGWLIRAAELVKSQIESLH